jgi:hypothetical protein
VLVAALAAVTAPAGCADPAPACPEDLPAACPDPAPTWAADAEPAIARACLACHGGQGPASIVLSTWDDVSAHRREVLSQVYACRMPPDDAPPLSADDRATLLAWLVCGAPEE